MLFSLSRAPAPILCHAFDALCFQGTLSDSKVFFFLIFIYLCLAELGLHCCVQVFSSCGKRGYFLVVVCKLLIPVASLVVAHGLSCPATCGIFLDQGSNLCLLHWQVDS